MKACAVSTFVAHDFTRLSILPYIIVGSFYAPSTESRTNMSTKVCHHFDQYAQIAQICENAYVDWRLLKRLLVANQLNDLVDVISWDCRTDKSVI